MSLEKPAARPDKDVGVRVKLASGYDQDDYLWDCVKTHGHIIILLFHENNTLLPTIYQGHPSTTST